MYVATDFFTHSTDNFAVVEEFTVEPVRDQRNIWRTTRKRMHLRGLVKGSSQSAIRTQLETIQNAYSGDNFSIALYEDDGTRSHFYLTTGDSLGGVRVVARLYPNLGQPCQYSTGVDYRIILEADYPANELSPMAYRETIQYQGNCGPEYSYQEPRIGLPFRIQEKQRTLQVIRQSGFALGLTGYPLVSDPLLPALEEPRLREIEQLGPTAAGANLRFTGFGMRWSYTFYSPTPQILIPNTR